MSRNIVLLVGVMALLGTTSLSAQDFALGQKYGQGVHAFFNGDYVKAYDDLTASIVGGTKDPRAFYFRGLAYLKLGRSQEATMDFQKGADLESKDPNKFYNVAKALERVQGKPRIELENYRVNARIAALEEAEKIRKARYDAIEREESRVVREQTLIQPPKADEPLVIKPAEKATDLGDDDPFAPKAATKDTVTKDAATKADKPAEKAVAVPAPKAPENQATEAKKPAATKPVAVEKTEDADDPFAAEPADKPAAAKKAEPEAEEKVTPKADATEKPKTQPAEKKTEKAAKPADDAGNDDPFAADDKPADEKPANSQPANAMPADKALKDDAKDIESKDEKADEKAKDDSADENTMTPDDAAGKADAKAQDTTKAAKAPAKEDMAAAEDDPFADPPATSEDKPTVEKKPAADNAVEEKVADPDNANDAKADSDEAPAK